MKKNTGAPRGGSVLTMALTLSVFGSLTTGCLPKTSSVPVTQYDIANYKPNTDGSGLAGTWILTYNNENPSGSVNIYGRDLIRIRPVDGAPGSYEATSCSQSIPYVNIITEDKIELPSHVDAGDVEWTTTDNGRMVTDEPVPYYSGGGVRTYRAVRLSSDPAFDMGTVAIDYASDSAVAIRQPATCFSETQQLGHLDDVLVGNYYSLNAFGSSASGIVSVSMSIPPSFDPTAVDTLLEGNDGSDLWIRGPYIGNINTTKSTIQGITGTIATPGNGYPDTGGSAILKIKL